MSVKKSLGASNCLPEAPAQCLIVPLIRLNCFLARSRENDIVRNPTKGYGHAVCLNRVVLIFSHRFASREKLPPASAQDAL